MAELRIVATWRTWPCYEQVLAEGEPRYRLLKKEPVREDSQVFMLTVEYSEPIDLLYLGEAVGRLLEEAAWLRGLNRRPALPPVALTEEEAMDFYEHGDPFDGTFTVAGEGVDDGI